MELAVLKNARDCGLSGTVDGAWLVHQLPDWAVVMLFSKGSE